jgi:hypothetical protein
MNSAANTNAIARGVSPGATQTGCVASEKPVWRAATTTADPDPRRALPLRSHPRRRSLRHTRPQRPRKRRTHLRQPHAHRAGPRQRAHTATTRGDPTRAAPTHGATTRAAPTHGATTRAAPTHGGTTRAVPDHSGGLAGAGPTDIDSTRVALSQTRAAHADRASPRHSIEVAATGRQPPSCGRSSPIDSTW